jgi:response regulator RpfG family c-di-GMP phosphodiesterase
LKAILIGFNKEESLDDLKIVDSIISKDHYENYNSELDLTNVLTDEGPFTYVVMNIDERGISPFKLYELITEIIGLRPFIFMGSLTSIKSQLSDDLLNAQKINYVIKKPIVPLELRKAIAQCEMWAKDEDFEQSILDAGCEEMRSMRIKNFYLYDQLPYDVYIELNPGRYGKIIAKNQFYTHQLIQSYSKKNIKFLFLKKDEHLKLLDSFINSLLSIYRTKKIDRSKIVKVHLKTIFFIREFLKTLSVTDEIIELVKLFAESISSTIKNSPSLIDLLIEIDFEGQMDFPESSLICAYVCEAIIRNLDWKSDMTKGRLVLASILHDISLENQDLLKITNLSDPALREFSDVDFIAFKEHPQRAQEMARLFSGYTELDFIVKQHHEHPMGEGFPQQLNVSNLTTISCIFILATQFSSRVARSKDGFLSQKEIIKSMQKIYHLGNFKDPMKAFIKILEP